MPSVLLPHPAQHSTHIRKTILLTEESLIFWLEYLLLEINSKCQVVVVISVLGTLESLAKKVQSVGDFVEGVCKQRWCDIFLRCMGMIPG